MTLTGKIDTMKVFFDAFDFSQNSIEELGLSLTQKIVYYPLFAYDRMDDQTSRATYLTNVQSTNSTQQTVTYDPTGSLYYNLTDADGAPNSGSPESQQSVSDLSVFWANTATPLSFEYKQVIVNFWYMFSLETLKNEYIVEISISSTESIRITPITYSTTNSAFSAIQLCLYKNNACSTSSNLSINLKKKYWYSFQVVFYNNLWVSNTSNILIRLIVTYLENGLNLIQSYVDITGAETGFLTT